MKPSCYKRLFKKFNAAPCRHVYVSRDDKYTAAKGFACAACAVGIRMIQHFKSLEATQEFMYGAQTMYDSWSDVLSAEGTGLSKLFVSGLDLGWETSWMDNVERYVINNDAEFVAGFNEGRAAALACKPARYVTEI